MSEDDDDATVPNGPSVSESTLIRALGMARSARRFSIDAFIVSWLPMLLGVGGAVLLGWALATHRVMILGAAGVMAFAPIAARWPVIAAFGLYAFLVPFDSVAAIGESGGATITRLIGILTSGALIVAALMNRRRFSAPSLPALFWGLLLIWSALSALWAVDPSLVFLRFFTKLSLFLLYIVAICFKPSPREFRTVCALAVLGGAAAAAVAAMYGVPDSEQARGALVIGEQVSNPNDLGAGLIPPLALAIAGCTLLVRRELQLLALGLTVLIGMGIYVSMSRGALLAIGVVLVVLLYRVKARGWIAAATVALLALSATMPDRFYERITRVFTGEDATGAGRTRIWESAIDALHRFGIFGAGLDNFATYRVTGRWVGGHNTYLTLWTELGVIGLAIMLAAIAAQLLAVRRRGRSPDTEVLVSACFAACIGVLAFAMFGDILWKKYFWLYWIMLSWVVRLRDPEVTEPAARYRDSAVRLKTTEHAV